MALLSGFFTAKNAPGKDDLDASSMASYLFFPGAASGNSDAELIEQDTISYKPLIEGIQTYAKYYVLLNTLIPISLVVTLEFVKVIQAPFLQHDLELYDKESMKFCQPISLTLHEELGSIDYIFADKTGTLTSNIMNFKACTIGSVCYDDDYNEDDYEYEEDFDDIEEDLPENEPEFELNVGDNIAETHGITVSQSLGIDPSVDSLALEDYDHVEPVDKKKDY